MTEYNKAAAARETVHAYEHLTPDVVLDALASVGLMGDGRLMALSSYENRVYQVHLESPVGSDDLAGDIVVAKFYRPDRWSDAQILEEHAFAAELMAAEIPVVGALVLNGTHAEPFQRLQLQRLAQPGRAPARAGGPGRAGMDRPLSGAHPHRGRGQAFRAPPGAEPADLWLRLARLLLAGGYLPLDMESRWRKAFERSHGGGPGRV